MLNKLNQITNAQTLQLQHAAAQSAAGQKPAQEEFDSILKRELKKDQGVQFSKHATLRVQERGIAVTENVVHDLNQAVQKAKEKGAKDVVVIGQNGAFIVNIPHNIVVTTMSKAEMQENIFTNIDSAVLM